MSLLASFTSFLTTSDHKSQVASVFFLCSILPPYWLLVPLFEPYSENMREDIKKVAVDTNIMAKNCNFVKVPYNSEYFLDHWSHFTEYLLFGPLLEPYRDKM